MFLHAIVSTNNFVNELMNKENIRTNRLLAVKSGLWGAVKSFAKRVPLWGDLVEGLEKCQDSIKEQTRIQMLGHLENRINNLNDEFKNKLQEYFNTQEGQLFCIKIMETALNAEYMDKQEIFVNALFNASDRNVSEDEKLRFIDLIRHLSKVALNVLYAIYEKYDKQLESTISLPQIIIRDVVTETHQKFQYSPELTDSAVRELRNIGLFSNVLYWNKSSSRISEGQYVNDTSFFYTLYTRRFIKFIKQIQ